MNYISSGNLHDHYLIHWNYDRCIGREQKFIPGIPGFN